MICLEGEKCFAQSFCFGGGKWSKGCRRLLAAKLCQKLAGKEESTMFILCVPEARGGYCAGGKDT